MCSPVPAANTISGIKACLYQDIINSLIRLRISPLRFDDASVEVSQFVEDALLLGLGEAKQLHIQDG
ncbi:hypothetical protein SAMN05892883_1906 [Jatrophihabitans sp. GAS493]|nr:hypothetical protein SAMN05892883_1906 [Jatrophihabitans sp. GAS493]